MQTTTAMLPYTLSADLIRWSTIAECHFFWLLLKEPLKGTRNYSTEGESNDIKGKGNDCLWVLPWQALAQSMAGGCWANEQAWNTEKIWLRGDEAPE